MKKKQDPEKASMEDIVVVVCFLGLAIITVGAAIVRGFSFINF
jgi:hypothetical protein